MSPDLLVLGCGFAGSAITRRARARGMRVLATVRSPSRASELRNAFGDGVQHALAGDSPAGLTVLAAPSLGAWVAQHVDGRTHVIVAFPPDGVSDERVAPALSHARAITYLSSTGVYGERRGAIDDDTPLPAAAGARAARILRAEAHYRAFGATVLRCPGIYGPTRGLHVRIMRGEHRIPGDGSRTLSRIHVEDLASTVLAAAESRGETFVLGDLAPAPQIEVVRFVCETYGVPMPPCVPWADVHESLRADRAVDPSRALARFGVNLCYPSYREGMAPSATQLPVQTS